MSVAAMMTDAARARLCSGVTRRGHRWRLLLVSLAAAMMLIASGTLPAQAKDAAHQNIHVELFGMGTYYRPNYFETGNNAGGVSGGVSFGWRFGYVRPGVEVRGTFATYSYMSLQQLGVGPHVVVDVSRFHPYAEYLIGYGKANFKEMNSTGFNLNDANTSTVRSVGGGLDVDVSRFWAVRLDVQRQSWDFDEPRFPFYPVAASVGARYLLHLPTRHGPR